MLVHPGTDCGISLERTGEPKDLVHNEKLAATGSATQPVFRW
jgi:hypothetical protein